MRHWVFAHNGDLKYYHPTLHGACRPVGSTDSERASCRLMQGLAAHGSFNMLLSNGHALWAHGSTQFWSLKRPHSFTTATLADEDLTVNFAEHTTPHDGVAALATEPLTANET